MKKYTLISVLFFVFAVFCLLSGCNNKNENAGSTQQMSTAAVQTTESSAKNTEASQSSTKQKETDATQAQYTTQEDELEILTPEAGNNSDSDTTEPDIARTTPVETTVAQQDETFPQLDDIIDEPIELPFVPVQ